MHTSFLKGNRVWSRILLSLSVMVLGLLVASPAMALGKVVWKKTTINEHTKKEAWFLECEIHLSKPPDIAHKGMKFEFTQMSEYERALVDGKEEPELRTIPLTNQQSLIESQTVGFLDPGSGQIQSRTRFSFKVTRAHGYRAGQWKVKIRDADTGATIGYETTLNFQGENPIIDRRSIVFTGKKKEKKAEQPAEASEEASEQPTEEAPAEEAAPVEEAAPAEPEGEGQVPPSIEEKPGGGCHHGPPHGGEWAWAALLALLGVYAFRRREA